jgi:hypothetical protein
MNALSPQPANDDVAAAPRISAPGLYELTHEQYHADPCAIPSLSSSIAKLLVRRSARHAWQAHARFGNIGMIPTRVMDDGSAMHAMMLGQAHLIDPIRTVYGSKVKDKEKIGKPVVDFKTQDAQDERDEIRGMGRIPILAHRLPELIRCKGIAQARIAETDDGPGFLAEGRSEICAVAVEDGVMLRCLIDRLPDDYALPPNDLKCTELSAAPGGWDRRLQTEYAFQDAFYRRVLKGAEGVERPPMRFFVIELDPPHGVAVLAADESLRALAEAEVERAMRVWRECTRLNVWPCYGKQTAWIGATPWQITASEDAAQIDAAALTAHVGAPATLSAVRALRAA